MTLRIHANSAAYVVDPKAQGTDAYTPSSAVGVALAVFHLPDGATEPLRPCAKMPRTRLPSRGGARGEQRQNTPAADGFYMTNENASEILPEVSDAFLYADRTFGECAAKRILPYIIKHIFDFTSNEFPIGGSCVRGFDRHFDRTTVRVRRLPIDTSSGDYPRSWR